MTKNLWAAVYRAVVVFIALGAAATAQAQLQITEIMFNPGSDSDNYMEWIEVVNTSGEDVFLDGSYFDDQLPNTIPTNGQPSVLSGQSENTVIPAGSTAILYDAVRGGLPTDDPNFDDSKFRASWGLGAEVPVVGLRFWPALRNDSSGDFIDGFGIWIDQPTYELDVDRNGTPADNSDDTVVYDNTLFNFSYQTVDPWPTPVANHSIYWTGNGSSADGSKWRVSQIGDATDPTTNSAVSYDTNTGVNRGSPGQVPVGGAPDPLKTLAITEILYNPIEPDPEQRFEYVELYNNTLAAIDLTGYVLDDDDDAHLGAANIAAGVIGPGEIGVLYNSVTTLAAMESSWGPDINFIPVATWTILGNSGDAIGLWPTHAAYMADALPGTTSPRRDFDSTTDFVDYLTSGGVWPNSTNGLSVFLTDLGSDPTNGTNWIHSLDGGDEGTGYLSCCGTPVTLTAHPGGDVGSPGQFEVVPDTGPLPGDFNGDEVVDAADYTYWRNLLGTDDDLNLNGNESGASAGVVDEDDYEYWREHYGDVLDEGGGGLASTVPEPASAILLLVALAGLGCGRRR